jgi:integrase
MTSSDRATVTTHAGKPSRRLRSKAGYEFDPSSDVWQLDGGSKINMSELAHLLGSGSKLHQGLKRTLERLAVETSSSYTENCLYYTMVFLRSPHFAGDQISAYQLQNYRATLSREYEYKLGYLRGFLRILSDFGEKGLSSDVIPYLASLQLRGNKKGAAVEHRCPHSGPFTTTEQSALINWATHGFEKGKISLKEYAWFYCLFVTGRRSVNLRALRAKDITLNLENDIPTFRLAVPRAKQKGGTYREEFREIMIDEDLYLLLMNLVETVQCNIKTYISDAIPTELLQEMPIFAKDARIKRVDTIAGLSRALRETPDYLHSTRDETTDIVRKLSQMCTAISERTGDTIHITQTRMRRTRATNLSRKNIGGTELAYLLDHSDTQQIGVYTENTPNVAERIDEAMLPALAPLAMAAKGMLIQSERDAIRANDPNSRIHKAGGVSMGNCGNEGFCAGGIKSCLICTQFQPWIDAPWNELLSELLDERDELRQSNAGNGVLQSYDLQISRSFAIKTAAEQIRSENG